MRDWILEMSEHAQTVQSAIDEGNHDSAWKLIHKFQEWCYERINAENHSLEYAGTLLSAVETFRIRILKKEKKYDQMLIHAIYQAAIDSRDLKLHRKGIESAFKKCKFKDTPVSDAISLYERIKRRPFGGATDFIEIRDSVSQWT